MLCRNKLMTKSQRDLPEIKRKSGGGGGGGKKRERRFSASQSRGFWQLGMRLASSFLSPLLFIRLIGLFFLICLFSPSLFFYPQRKWPWRVGRLWAEASQSRFEKRGRRSKTSCWISDCMRLLRACVCVRVHSSSGVVSTGWPDTGVGFRGCLGNEAETILLTPFLRQTGKVTLGS